jgi:hypothetical protein
MKADYIELLTCQAGSRSAVSSHRLGPKYWRSLHRLAHIEINFFPTGRWDVPIR